MPPHERERTDTARRVTARVPPAWPWTAVERFFADDLFLLGINHIDPPLEGSYFRVHAFGQEIALKREVPVTLRTASVAPQRTEVQ